MSSVITASSDTNVVQGPANNHLTQQGLNKMTWLSTGDILNIEHVESKCKYFLSRKSISISFKWIFYIENICISIQISLEYVPKGPIDNKSALV